MLMACQTTKLSDANKATICIALHKTKVTVLPSELAHLSPETIRQLKANPAVRKELGC